jgi:hypothetical protein
MNSYSNLMPGKVKMAVLPAALKILWCSVPLFESGEDFRCTGTIPAFQGATSDFQGRILRFRELLQRSRLLFSFSGMESRKVFS